MSLTEIFIQKAKAAGVEAEIIQEPDLTGRLINLFRTFSPVTAADLGKDLELAASVTAALSESGAALTGPGETQRARLGVTKVAALLADTGSQVVHSGQPGAMKASLLPPIHLALARESDLHEDAPKFLAQVTGKLPSRMVFITGPSRTGDIEATMTTGVHGPGRSLLWIVAAAPK